MVPREERQFTSQLLAVKLVLVFPEGYRPPVPAAYSQAPSGVTTASALLALGISFRKGLKNISILTKAEEKLALIMNDGKIYTNTLKEPYREG